MSNPRQELERTLRLQAQRRFNREQHHQMLAQAIVAGRSVVQQEIAAITQQQPPAVTEDPLPILSEELWLSGEDLPGMFHLAEQLLGWRESLLFASAILRLQDPGVPAQTHLAESPVKELADLLLHAADRPLDELRSLMSQIVEEWSHWRRFSCWGPFSDPPQSSSDWLTLGLRAVFHNSYSPPKNMELLATLLQELLGNPFTVWYVSDYYPEAPHTRSLLRQASWRRIETVPVSLFTTEGGRIPRMATTIYEDQVWEDLPILGDALEEAGCLIPAMVDHARQPGFHCRGCWLIDFFRVNKDA